jgi:NAD+ synthase (glutamine-hydrolysing)
MGNGRGNTFMKVYNEKIDKPMTNQIKKLISDLRDKKQFNAKEYVEKKAELLNEYMNKFNLKACVVGISGGVDSAVVLGIINYASKKENSPIKKILPLLLPITKSTGVTNQYSATERGKGLCEALGVKGYVVDLSTVDNEIRKCLEDEIKIEGQDWAIGQLGPYSRTPVLYYTTSLLCQEGLNAIVCGTTNRDEGAYLGYVGKASDGMVDVQIISDIHKSEVYKVAEFLNIPEVIMKATPSGDMYDYRTDETVFGASYDFVELYLNYLNYKEAEKEKLIASLDDESKEQFLFYTNNLENLHKYNRHKYLVGSPAVHLDLYDSSVKDGWENYYQRTKELMKA